MRPKVHYFGGQGIGWALDEDLERARRSVCGRVSEGSFARAPIIHSAWWPPLLQAGGLALKGKQVVCFSDNPPAFYLTRSGFEEAAARVDLWIARSREAVTQFQKLGLPVAYAPYTVDPSVFHPLSSEERLRIRGELGLGEGDFTVGNFHRDSLEKDLSLPKAQKGPDLFADLVEEARKSIPSLKVLLAGPRRHWLCRELERRGIPFVFSGERQDGDDFRVNVLPRERLNRLYAALDCIVISSRWEGGPYAVLESLLAGRPVISTPVGMASDLLGQWLYSSMPEGAALLNRIASGQADFSGFRAAALESHSPGALGDALMRAYEALPTTPPTLTRSMASFLARGMSRIHPVFRKPLGSHPRVSGVMEKVRSNSKELRGVAAKAASIADAEKTTR
jgi:glycosyltransferase involved in cell wall biosynthesis